jgi:phage host-nuclease inhibitor protein Gam
MQLDLEPEQATERETAVTSDGFIYEIETGEIVGRIDLKATWRAEKSDDVEWSLELRAKIESDLAAVRLRKAALLKNLSAIERDHERRLAWWEWRFRPDVVAFARKSLEGSKSKTARFAWGAIKFRMSSGTNTITDPDAAVAFVQERKPEAVKVERSVTVKTVLEVAAALGEAAPTMAHFLKSTGPRESATIETGVGG